MYVLATEKLQFVDPAFGGRRLYASEDAAKAAVEEWIALTFDRYPKWWRFAWVAPCKEDADRLAVAAWFVLSRDGRESERIAAVLKMEDPS